MMRYLGTYWDYLRAAASQFAADHGTLMAAAVTFYSLLSLFPLLLLGVSVFAYILGSSDRAFEQVLAYFREFVPIGGGYVEDILRSLVTARGVIGLIGLVVLVWTGSQIFMTLEAALNIVWKVEKSRGLVKGRLWALLLLVMVGISFVASIGATFVLTALRGLNIPLLGVKPGAVPHLLSAVSVLVSLVFSTGMFLLIYKLVPNTRVEWRPALRGAITASIIWEIAKRLYVLYLAHFANFGRVYGSLGSAIILIMWIYYSAMILLYGAEISHVRQKKPAEGSMRMPPP